MLKTFFRNFKKNKFFTILNILGLALGMSVFLLIALYVKFENSYEDFNANASDIYRVTLDSYLNHERVSYSAENYPAAGPALASFPEVVSYCRLYNLGYKNNVIITNQEALPEPIAIKHRRFLYADSAFLSMMGYRLRSGDLHSALAEPNCAVITEQYATIYFGNADPIGKTLHMHDDDDNDELVKVTGVIDDAYQNTHLKFDVLFSYKTLFNRPGRTPDYAVNRFDRSWQRSDMYTYIQLKPGTDVKTFEARFPDLIATNNPALKESNQQDILQLQPLHDIHLTSHLAEEAEGNGDSRIVYFSGMIALFVLVIALINYINLATAQAMERAKEVGVRKILGAAKKQLVTQFITEAACVNLISILIAYAVVGIALPAFNQLTGLSLETTALIKPWFIELLLVLWITASALSGFYPAVVLSSFKPISIAKAKFKNSIKGIFLRKSLVVFQFMASVALIASTLIVFRQLDYMMKSDIGMNIDQVVVIERPGMRPTPEMVNSFRNSLKNNAAVESMSLSATVPGKQREYKVDIKRYGASDDQIINMRINSMDYDFLDVFKMKLIAGRGFSEDFVHDPDTSIIITESAARLLGFENPSDAVGQTLAIPDWTNPIVAGVVNDYHQVSFKNKLEPSVFYCDPTEGEFYSVRIKSADVSNTIESIRQAWDQSFPGNPFDYFFLDDYFNRQYKNEQQFGVLFTTLSVLALIIGCLGLFGLSSYTAVQRTKEIGIRKVLGSTDSGIFVLLSTEYIRLILLAVVLSVPLVYFLMQSWIETFPYRTSIGSLVFIIAGGAVLIIALVAVSFQTLKAVRANAVDALRYE